MFPKKDKLKNSGFKNSNETSENFKEKKIIEIWKFLFFLCILTLITCIIVLRISFEVKTRGPKGVHSRRFKRALG